MLSSFVGALVVAGLSLGLPDPAEISPSYLFRNPTTSVAKGELYHPQEGDILLFDDHCRWATWLYNCIGTGGPMHAALVFYRPDGTPALMEAGPHFVQKVFVWDIGPRLRTYDGTVLVRRLCTPLTAEQSTALTEFCLAQEGKSYALARVLLQGTPLKARGPIRTQCLGRTYLDRERWMCSELVVAAMTAAGVLNAKEHPANSFYPRDLCYDDVRHDLSKYYDPPALWYPRAELEYSGSMIRMLTPRE
jgi:hypothetical protein